MLAGLIIPPAVVPTIWVLQKLGLFKTLPGLILVEVASADAVRVLLFRAFVAAIPRELDEAAIIDGASRCQLFFRVIFPLLRPVMITVIVLTSVAVFNDFVNPLYFLPGDEQRHRPADPLQLPEPVQHAVEPALHGHRADHHPAADPVHLLQAQDRVRHHRRRGQGLSRPPWPTPRPPEVPSMTPPTAPSGGARPSTSWTFDRRSLPGSLRLARAGFA